MLKNVDAAARLFGPFTGVWWKSHADAIKIDTLWEILRAKAALRMTVLKLIATQ
jgi:hypothetical protein